MSRKARPPVPPRLRLAALVQAAAALLWVPQAWLLAAAVFSLTGPYASPGEAVTLAMVFAGLGLLRAALDAWGGRLAFRAARDELTRQRARAVAVLSQRAPLDPTLPPSGEIAGLLAEQAEAVVPYLQRYVPVRWRLILVPGVILPVVAWHSWAAALILLVAAPLIPLCMALVGIRAKKASEDQLAAVGSMNGLLMDRLRGLPTIRALKAEHLVAERLGTLAADVKRRTLAVLRIAFLSSAALELFSALGVALVAVYVGSHLFGQAEIGTWGQTLGLTEGLFILLLAPAFFEPLREMSALWHDRASGEAALRAMTALDGPPLVPVAPTEAPPEGPVLRLDGVTFTYPGSAPLVTGVDLALYPGEKLALYGPSGGGKSTLLALAAGLLRPDKGVVVRRGKVGWIGHRPFVMNASLAANVSLGRSGVAAAPVLQRLLPGHDPTRRVGEGGIGLSGGETLRLALARAIADPDASLILADEPTAHLDASTAEEVINALLAAAQGRALLIATHDPRLAARMDRVVEVGA
ncbi:thiol reductant ABC exporter subunit CydD [Niveispirillum lacus]|uniref:Thiol reductant ABC exporter subunit CydD n=1 Tax=Niveispirillum lacus TaxID=1981099 RepID=A0A255Z1G8_9PROT|nr:thiol reductant ABC exporter subunit CydD [Niveispirillum lacus]OYQ34500.1 thiol reductant ABC exporter subunit CydD [Niveispirillum lacus]